MARKTAPTRRRSAAALDTSSTGPISADASLATAQQNAAYFKKLLTGMTHGHDSVREIDYKGHHVVVKTTYDVTIDGKPFQADLGVTNGGDVHYHGMPNVAFASALDLVKAVIDTFPNEFGKGKGGGGADDGGHGHGEHGHDDHNHGPMMARRGTRKKRVARATARRRR